MKFADRLRVASIGTSAATLTLGAAVLGGRTLAKCIADGDVSVGDTGWTFYTDDGAGNWENSLYTITSTTVITRTSVQRSSAGGTSPATFSGSALTVFNEPSATWLSTLSGVRDIPFTQTVPLSVFGVAYMPQQTVASALAFTPAAAAVRGALVYLRLVADGTNAPTFTGFKEWGGSLGYDNRNGIVNELQFFYDGYDYWFSASQAVGATPTAAPDTVAPVMVGSLTPSAVTVAGFTVSWQAATDNTAVTGYETSTDGGVTYASAGNVLTKAFTGLTANTSYAVRVRAFDAAGNKATPLALTVTTPATADTTAPVMVGTLVVSNQATSGYTVTWQAATDNVGVAGYEFSIDGGATYADIGNVLTRAVTGRTSGVTDTVAVRAYDAAGNKATPLTTTATTAAAGSLDSAPRMATLTREVESGTGPYTYVGSGAQGFGSNSGDSTCTKAFQSGQDGYLTIRINTVGVVGGNEIFFGVDAAATFQAYTTMDYGVVGHTNGYSVFTNGSAPANLSTVGAVNDLQRFKRTGTTLYFDISKDGGSSWTNINTWTGVSTGVLYLHGSVTFSGSFTTIECLGLA